MKTQQTVEESKAETIFSNEHRFVTLCFKSLSPLSVHLPILHNYVQPFSPEVFLQTVTVSFYYIHCYHHHHHYQE